MHRVARAEVADDPQLQRAPGTRARVALGHRRAEHACRAVGAAQVAVVGQRLEIRARNPARSQDLRQAESVLPMPRHVGKLGRVALAHFVGAAREAQAHGGHAAEHFLRHVDADPVRGVVGLLAARRCQRDLRVAVNVVGAEAVLGALLAVRAGGGDDIDRRVADRIDVVRRRQRELVGDALAHQQRRPIGGHAAAAVGVEQRLGAVGRQVDCARAGGGEQAAQHGKNPPANPDCGCGCRCRCVNYSHSRLLAHRWRRVRLRARRARVHCVARPAHCAKTS